MPSNASIPTRDPSAYRPTNNFLSRRHTDLKGIFTGDVIEACFDGEIEAADNDCVRLVGELAECYFGLIVDPVEYNVVDGQVLQVNPVQATQSDHWTTGAITRMQSLAKDHRGKVWNAYKDPHIGNKERWVPEREY